MSRLATKNPHAPRRGLSRVEAAVYVGVGTTKFDEMIDDGRMPCARLIDGRRVWDIRRLDLAFDALPAEGEERLKKVNSWSDR